MRTTGSVILLVLRVALGGLFLFAAYHKVGSAEKAQLFLDSMKAFRILPEHLLIPAAFTLPWVEALAGLALVVGLWSRAAALIIAALLGVFIAAIVSAINRGLDLECSCFGKFHLYCQKVDWCKVYENAVLTGVALLLVAFGGGRFGLDGLFGRPKADPDAELSE